MQVNGCLLFLFVKWRIPKKIIDNKIDNYYTSASFRSQTVNALLDEPLQNCGEVILEFPSAADLVRL